MKSTVTWVELPSRYDVLEKLTALANSRISPEAAAEWASEWILADQQPGVEVRADDKAIWSAILQMHGADLRVSPNEYLHGLEDFAEWLSQFRQAHSSGEQ